MPWPVIKRKVGSGHTCISTKDIWPTTCLRLIISTGSIQLSRVLQRNCSSWTGQRHRQKRLTILPDDFFEHLSTMRMQDLKRRDMKVDVMKLSGICIFWNFAMYHVEYQLLRNSFLICVMLRCNMPCFTVWNASFHSVTWRMLQDRERHIENQEVLHWILRGLWYRWKSMGRSRKERG